MKKSIILLLLFSTRSSAYVAKYVNLSSINLKSERDSVEFVLNINDFDAEWYIQAFGLRHSFNLDEKKIIKNLPILNFCSLEKASGLSSPEELRAIKKCLDGKKCNSTSNKGKVEEKLYIRCGRGNNESIYFIFNNHGKLIIEIDR